MAVSTTQTVTGIFTTAQREFLRGERSSENPEQYRRNIRHMTRQRYDEIEEDLSLMTEVGEEELREEFFNRFDRHRYLEAQLVELREEVARLREAADVSPDEEDSPDE